MKARTGVYPLNPAKIKVTLGKIQEKAFYLLFLFLPVQLGYHFNFSFAQIAGIRSDYLTPVIYFSDLIIFAVILPEFFYLVSQFPGFVWEKGKQAIIFFLLFLFLLISVTYIAENTGAAFYKFLKIIELSLLYAAAVRIKPQFSKAALFLTIALFYTSLIALAQFFLQRSLGGLLWYLGERTFSASSPGIAAVNVNGSLLLRPYATFPHPNVLGAFLALASLSILFFIKGKRFKVRHVNFYILSLFLTVIALGLTFSRAALTVFFSGIILYYLLKIKKIFSFFQKKAAFLIVFSSIFIFSIISPLFLQDLFKNKSLLERKEMVSVSWEIFKKNIIFGTGLNNTLEAQYGLFSPKVGLYAREPVHNIYLLLLTELGLTGFIVFFFFLKFLYQKAVKKRISLLILLQLLSLGMFDHYLITLHQGQLIFLLMTSFAL